MTRHVPRGQRKTIAVRLSPAARTTLDRMCRELDRSHTEVVERALAVLAALPPADRALANGGAQP